MSQFKLVSPFQPMGDQVQAIQELVDGLKAGKKEQVLLGGTGTGKTAAKDSFRSTQRGGSRP